ncbi:PAS domain-containing protein [Kitasatospora arboriphila]
MGDAGGLDGGGVLDDVVTALIDAQGTVLAWSAAAEELTGRTARQTCGRPFAEQLAAPQPSDPAAAVTTGDELPAVGVLHLIGPWRRRPRALPPAADGTHRRHRDPPPPRRPHRPRAGARPGRRPAARPPRPEPDRIRAARHRPRGRADQHRPRHADPAGHAHPARRQHPRRGDRRPDAAAPRTSCGSSWRPAAPGRPAAAGPLAHRPGQGVVRPPLRRTAGGPERQTRGRRLAAHRRHRPVAGRPPPGAAPPRGGRHRRLAGRRHHRPGDRRGPGARLRRPGHRGPRRARPHRRRAAEDLRRRRPAPAPRRHARRGRHRPARRAARRGRRAAAAEPPAGPRLQAAARSSSTGRPCWRGSPNPSWSA